MENVEVTNELVETTTKKSKGFIVGLIAAATAVVGAIIYKRRKRKEVVEAPESVEEIFVGIETEEIQ